MKQVCCEINTGRTKLLEVPPPLVKPGHVLIATAYSVISPGTEKAALDLARASLIAKARARPDQLRRVLQKMREEGVWQTLDQIARRLQEPMPMGYSSAGVVLAVGSGVQDLKMGDRVASNGPHAEVVCVPRHLCVRVPENVPLDHAAFTVLGAIALHGIRLANVELGSRVAVIGLGLVGQLAVLLLKAQSCRVLATDLNPKRCEVARALGADVASPDLSDSTIMAESCEAGMDAVLVAAASDRPAPLEKAIQWVRKKGRIVVVGDVPIELSRRAMYFKEAEVVVSCSYGPGRYDPDYEERNWDYPLPYVRWTEQRNLEAVVEIMSQRRLPLDRLITHRFPIDQAESAYTKLTDTQALGILLEYPLADTVKGVPTSITLRAKPTTGNITVGCVGAGNFMRYVLLPILRQQKEIRLKSICSAGGLSAAHAARAYGFEVATSDPAAVIGDPEIQVVLLATRHNLHAEQVIAALMAGKHVFVEKPLCIKPEELAAIEEVLSRIQKSGQNLILTVGYNRRFSPAVQMVRAHLDGISQPLTVHIRFNAGAIPANHWTQVEDEGGGRLIGEACHAVDLAIYLTRSPVVRVFAESIGGTSNVIHDDQAAIVLRHANGSVTSIAYWAGGDRVLPKERVEVAGGGRMAIVDDFRAVTLAADGKQRQYRWRAQNKGHRAELQAFFDAVREGTAAPIPWEEIRSGMLATFLVVRSLREGQPFDIP